MEGDRSQRFFAAIRYFDDLAKKDRAKDGARKRITSKAKRYGVNWLKMRIVLSSDIPDGMNAVRGYSLDDLIVAHASLDAMESLRELERERSKREARHRKAARR